MSYNPLGRNFELTSMNIAQKDNKIKNISCKNIDKKNN